MLAEEQVPIIAFVWRPEEIGPPVTQMAQRTGSRAVFDFSMMGAEALHSFLQRADPAGHVSDIKISAPALMNPSVGQAPEGNRGPEPLGRMPVPVSAGGSFRPSCSD